MQLSFETQWKKYSFGADILIFETPGTSRSSEKCHCSKLWVMDIKGTWAESTPKIPINAPFYRLTPSGHLKIHPGTPISPRLYRHTLSIYKGSPKHSQTSLTSSGNLISPRVSSDNSWPHKTLSILFGKCLGVVKAVPGGQGNVYKVSEGVLGSSGVSWGGLTA